MKLVTARLELVLLDLFERFGWATDPEGNRIELWQPPAAR